MENKHPIGELMDSTMERIKSMVDVNTIIGQPIKADDVTLIPISKLSFGFGSGGGDYGKDKPAGGQNFGGGSAAGVNISPVAFLIVKGDSVKLLPVAPVPATTVGRMVDMVPEMFDKVTGYMDKKKAENSELL